MEAKKVVSYYKSDVEPFVMENKFFFTAVGGVLATAGLLTFLLSNRGKRFVKDVAGTAYDLAEEVQHQMVKESGGKIVKERVKAKELV